MKKIFSGELELLNELSHSLKKEREDFMKKKAKKKIFSDNHLLPLETFTTEKK